MSRADRTGNSFPERVYVSRENFSARGRSVENRGELRATLDAFDVAVVTPETMSVAEQIWLYAGTELLVGPHGAGLTNMIFSGDARVLEFLRGIRRIDRQFSPASVRNTMLWL